MNIEAVITAISQYIPFDQNAFNLYAQYIQVIHLQKNEIWEAEGSLGKNIGFINQGIVRQFYLRDGEEYTDAFFTEGDFFGNFISYLKQSPSLMTIQALENCEVLALPFDRMQELYDTLPLFDRFGRLIAEQKLLEIHDRTYSFLVDSPEERYYKLLQQKPDLINRIPQYYIAQYLGIRPQSLSRIRARKGKS